MVFFFLLLFTSAQFVRFVYHSIHGRYNHTVKSVLHVPFLLQFKIDFDLQICLPQQHLNLWWKKRNEKKKYGHFNCVRWFPPILWMNQIIFILFTFFFRSFEWLWEYFGACWWRSKYHCYNHCWGKDPISRKINFNLNVSE